MTRSSPGVDAAMDASVDDDDVAVPSVISGLSVEISSPVFSFEA